MLDLKQFAAALRAACVTMPAAEKHGLTKGAELIEESAKALIGTEQGNWAPLSQATMEGFVHPYGFRVPGKIELGFTGQVSSTDPLLRTGALRDSIGHQVTGRQALIGSTSMIAAYQEFGTSGARMPIPPRPFLGAAAFRDGAAAARAIGEAVQHAVAGRRLP